MCPTSNYFRLVFIQCYARPDCGPFLASRKAILGPSYLGHGLRPDLVLLARWTQAELSRCINYSSLGLSHRLVLVLDSIRAYKAGVAVKRALLYTFYLLVCRCDSVRAKL